jgi:EmrB/QacA subfamily drug resistance transporter
MTSHTNSSKPAVSPSPWRTFVLCSLGAYITTLDLSVVNVAFPEIIQDFDISRADASWIVTAYNICFAGLLIVSGKVADQLGRRRLFHIGVLTFGVGSIVCALASGLGVLVAGRVIQGIGGALLSPASLGLLLAAFPPERRTTIVAMFGGIGALGVASGPSLGALLISLSNWRAAFWVNVPVCAAVLLFGRTTLRETTRVTDRRLPDLIGAALITTSLATLALGISRSEVWGWTDPKTLGALAINAVAAPLFWKRQQRHHNPILDLNLFRSRGFNITNVSSIAFYAGFAASGLNNVLFLRQVWGYTVLRAGLLSALAPLTVALLARPAGRLAAKFGLRPFVVVGPAIVATSALTLRVTMDATPRPWLFVLIAECTAVGIAAFISVNSAAAVAGLPPDRLSIGGAVNNTCRQVGSVLGVAILVAVLGSPETRNALLAAHHRGYLYVSVVALIAAVIGIAQPSTAVSAQTQTR